MSTDKGEAPADADHPAGVTKHRVEALSDGIFAVAMTLLVIELKLPDHASIKTQAQLMTATAQLLPKFIAWVISFLVLAIFWVSHHRQFHYVHRIGTRLIWVNMLMLAFVSLMPFSSAMVGEYGGSFFGQAIYAANMAMLGLVSLWSSRLVHRQSRDAGTPMPDNVYRAARLRTVCLLGLCGLDLVIAWFAPPFATMAYMLMFLAGRVARRYENSSEPVKQPR
jgi:uncharacterized membrane protein